MLSDSGLGYTVRIHRSVSRFLRNHPDLSRKWDEISDQIQSRPRLGPHIDHLKGPWNCSFRWDEGSYRIKYEVSDDDAEIFFYDANSRGDAYKGWQGAERRR